MKARATRSVPALVLVGMAVLGAPAPGRASPAPGTEGPSRIELRTSAAYRSRSWENDQGKPRAWQLYLPLDLSWRTRTIRLTAGGDFARGESKLPGEIAGPVTPYEIRGGSEASFLHDRLRGALGFRAPLSRAAIGPQGGLTAGLLDDVILGLPRAWNPPGSRLIVQAAGQPLRRAGFALQTGLAWERRGAYDLFADGLRVDPGDPWRLAAGLIGGRRALSGELGVLWERAGRSRFGGYSYQEGRLVRVQLVLRRQLERGNLDFTGIVANRDGGTVEPAAPLDPAGLAGGDAVRLRAAGTRITASGEWGVSLGVAGVRGFPGELGRAAAVEPGLSWARRAGGGRVGLALTGMIGTCRRARPLRGVDLSVSWQREWSL